MAVHPDTASSNADPTGNLLGLLGKGDPAPWKSAVAYGVAAGGFSLSIYRSVRDVWRRRHFSVNVSDRDDIYDDVREWLLKQLPEERQKSIEVYSVRHTGKPWHSDYRTERGLFYAYDGSRSQTVEIDGHKVEVLIEQPEFGSSQRLAGKVGFICRSLEGKRALVNFLGRVADDYESRNQGARVRLANRWGDWVYTPDLPSRDISTVILAGTQREELVADLERFIADEKDYERLGIPWHRGYLFHGPPGVGKTSIAKGLAEHLNMTLYAMPLSDLEADTDLARMLSQVEPRSMLLLEDIDVVHGAKTRDDSGKGVSLSGLLNALDGVATPHGLVTVMTTNNRDVLDEALIRTGRADKQVEISFLVDEQLHRLVQALVGRPVDNLPSVEGHKVTPADVVEALKPYIGEQTDMMAEILPMELENLLQMRDEVSP